MVITPGGSFIIEESVYTYAIAIHKVDENDQPFDRKRGTRTAFCSDNTGLFQSQVR